MIQFIMHHNDRFSYLDSARLALEGGCKWIQLRMKEASDAEIVACGKEVSALCKKYGATFIVDDHVEIAKAVGADGVHLGKNDMPISEARKILGDKYIIGGTANTYADVENHYRNGANYIGCGPFRFTTTKKNLSPILGLDGYSDVVSQMKKNGIDIPIVAIGGITEADIPAVKATGVTGIALSGEVLNAKDPVEKMKTILKLLK